MKKSESSRLANVIKCKITDEEGERNVTLVLKFSTFA
jgi:hypothetical protein